MSFTLKKRRKKKKKKKSKKKSKDNSNQPSSLGSVVLPSSNSQIQTNPEEDKFSFSHSVGGKKVITTCPIPTIVDDIHVLLNGDNCTSEVVEPLEDDTESEYESDY